MDYGYNYLNLLGTVKSGSTVKATYRWLADGTKAGVKPPAGNAGFEYLGSLSYMYPHSTSTGLRLESAAFGGGRIEVSHSTGGASYSPIYHITDHLGSVRVLFKNAATVSARNDYYAFGKRTLNRQLSAGNDTSNRRLYNGKEKLITGDVNFLDYGARPYDTEIGRWFNVDPLAEVNPKFTPYHYASNNPINRTDPTGMLDDEFEINGHGYVVNRIKKETIDAFYMVQKVDGEWQRMRGDMYSILFEHGTVKDVINTTLMVESDEYNITLFQIKGDDNAQKLFEIMSNNPYNVEWSHTEVGLEGSDNSFVGTSHTPGVDASATYLIRNGYTIRAHTHNHPYLPYVSNSDKNFSSKLNVPTYIYDNDGRFEPIYFRYDGNGQISDYNSSKQRMTPW